MSIKFTSNNQTGFRNNSNINLRLYFDKIKNRIAIPKSTSKENQRYSKI